MISADEMSALWWEIVNYPTEGTLRRRSAKIANRWRYWNRMATDL